MKFGPIITAMVTPFKDDLTVDYDQAAALAKHLVAHGSDGLVVTGTTGESSTLTMDESARLYTTVMAAVGDRATVIAGSGANSTAEAVSLTQAAEQAGVHASLQVAPYYNKPSQEGFYQHFKTVAANTALPIFLYNIPGRTAKNVDAATIIRLAEVPNIVGVKEASGDFEQISRIVRDTADDFLLYSGDDFLTLPIVALGGVGVISVASHLVGQDMKDMILAHQTGDVRQALSLHFKLMDLFKVLFLAPSPAPVKAALGMIGLPVGGVRLPLVTIDDNEAAKVRAVLSGLGMV
jgi:4-hydroxy-tetrahydrodipicolinate synthase